MRILRKSRTVVSCVHFSVANQLPLNTLVLRERAAAIYDTIVAQARSFADAEPDAEASCSLLAFALNNLATFLSALGEREAALATAQEAVALHRQLAAVRPDAFAPDLAMSLNNLANRLSDLGQREEALAAAQEAVTLLSPFFLDLPVAFSQMMQRVVYKYRDCAGQLQQAPDAALLTPIIEKLNTLPSSPGGAS
jgi:tetratricopeptide (TPR) repeat protein